MPKLIHSNFIEQASKQILSEFLGFEEGLVYYLLLTKKEQLISKEFSYSKRYRLLKRLYEAGAVGKLKPENQDFFNYFLLPPSFLYFNKIDLKIIEYLESIYLKHHSYIYDSPFIQLIVKNENYILIFLLKYFMKEKARLVINELNLNDILGEKITKVNIISNKKESKRRIGIIDNNLAFEFFNIQNITSSEFMGYLVNKNSSLIKKDLDYVSKIDVEIKGLLQ